MAVVDVASVAQLTAEIARLDAQLTTARAHLAQAQAQLGAMTGGRGMQLLLSGTVRNYLPPDYPGLAGALAGGNPGYAAFSSDVQGALAANAVISTGELASLPPPAAQQVAAGRAPAALLTATAREALAHSSSRFNDLQGLINAIGSASDQKASLDLAARIAAEQGMLLNEQTKLQVLYESARALQWATGQRLREQVILAHGRFAARFQPIP